MFSAKPHILIPGDPAFDDLERWEWADDALQNFLALRNRDAVAFNWIYANMKQWNREGYHPITRQDQKAMEAPSGFDAAQQVDHPPWMGEIREIQSSLSQRQSSSQRNPRHYRLYYFDIADVSGEPAHRMLVTQFSEKRIYYKRDGSVDNARTDKAQTAQMINAMEAAKNWCADNGRAYRPWTFPPTPDQQNVQLSN